MDISAQALDWIDLGKTKQKPGKLNKNQMKANKNQKKTSKNKRKPGKTNKNKGKYVKINENKKRRQRSVLVMRMSQQMYSNLWPQHL